MNKSEKILFSILSLAIIVYLGIRCFYVPMIHDETVTYYTYIQNATFVPPWAYWDANNHLLNSALSSLFTYLFGSSKFIIRFASWISIIPFIYFIFKISDSFKNIWKRWVFIIPLLTTPFLIEFFSLTRGYGMSMAWFLGSFYFALKYKDSRSSKDLACLSITGFLAALSNLSVIVSILVIYGWILLYQLIVLKQNISITISRWALIFITPLIPLIYYVFLLKEKGLLYYGGDDFIQFTLKPFAKFFFNSKEFWWVIIIPFMIITFAQIIKLYKNKLSHFFSGQNIFPFVLLVSVCAIFLQHFVLGVNYPEDRAALYLFPLIVGSWSTLPISFAKYFTPILILPVLWFPLDLIKNANLTHSRLWVHEHIPKRFNDQINEIKSNGYPPTISAYFLRYYIWDFNQINSEEGVSTINFIDYPSIWSDMLMVDSIRINKVNLSDFKQLDYDPISGNTLLQRKIPNSEIIRKDTLIQDIVVENEFTNIFDFNGKLWGNKPMALYYDFDVQASKKVMNTLIISTLFDINGTEIFSNKYNFNQVSENWEDKKNWKVKLYLPPFPDNAGRFVTYIYNPQKETHLFNKIKSSLAEISHPQ